MSKLILDANEFQENTNTIRNAIADGLKDLVKDLLDDELNYQEVEANLEERMESGAVQNLGDLIAQLTLAIQDVNGVTWDGEE